MSWTLVQHCINVIQMFYVCWDEYQPDTDNGICHIRIWNLPLPVSSKYGTSTQCMPNVGPPSTTSAQHWSNIGEDVSCLLGVPGFLHVWGMLSYFLFPPEGGRCARLADDSGHSVWHVICDVSRDTCMLEVNFPRQHQRIWSPLKNEAKST